MDYRAALIAEGVPPDTAQRFIVYHMSNPQVWKAFESKAQALKQKGISRYGAKAIFEVIRYEALMEKGADGFKANNNWAAYYARIYALKHKDESFFETREIKGVHENA